MALGRKAKATKERSQRRGATEGVGNGSGTNCGGMVSRWRAGAGAGEGRCGRVVPRGPVRARPRLINTAALPGRVTSPPEIRAQRRAAVNDSRNRCTPRTRTYRKLRTGRADDDDGRR
ncbi:unnamed protein product, partial [Iphiclides podalirius]